MKLESSVDRELWNAAKRKRDEWIETKAKLSELKTKPLPVTQPIAASVDFVPIDRPSTEIMRPNSTAEIEANDSNLPSSDSSIQPAAAPVLQEAVEAHLESESVFSSISSLSISPTKDLEDNLAMSGESGKDFDVQLARSVAALDIAAKDGRSSGLPAMPTISEAVVSSRTSPEIQELIEVESAFHDAKFEAEIDPETAMQMELHATESMAPMNAVIPSVEINAPKIMPNPSPHIPSKQPTPSAAPIPASAQQM